jgi:hypothetical protein
MPMLFQTPAGCTLRRSAFQAKTFKLFFTVYSLPEKETPIA